MHRLISAMCWLILGTRLVPAFRQPAEASQKNYKGPGQQQKRTRRQSSQ